MYQRKTRDEFVIEQFTAWGWELATTETSWRDARRCVREYRANQPEYPVRWRKVRVRIETFPALNFLLELGRHPDQGPL